jgi:phage shock protein C
MSDVQTGPPTVEGRPQPKLRRSVSDKVVAGVCGGLGGYFNTDPVWFRIAFVVVTLAGGAGVLIYLIAWLVIPQAADGEDLGGSGSSLGEQGPLVAGIALVGIGLVLLINTLVPWFDRVMWPMAVIAAGVGLLFLGSRRERN